MSSNHLRFVLLLAAAAAARAASPAPVAPFGKVVQHAVDFWSGGEWLRDPDSAVKSYFHPDGEWCFSTCARGHKEIAAAMKGFAAMMTSLRVAPQHEFVTGVPHIAAINCVGAMRCRGGPPGRTFQMIGTTFYEADPATGLVRKEITTVDADELARFGSECMDGAPTGLFVPSIDRDLLDSVVRRWEYFVRLMYGSERVSDDRLPALFREGPGIAPGAVVCMSGRFGCQPFAALEGFVRRFRAVSSDAEFKVRRTWYSGADQVGADWTAVLTCRYGGRPLAASGHILIFVDGKGRITRKVVTFDSVRVAEQAAECMARAPDDKADL